MEQVCYMHFLHSGYRSVQWLYTSLYEIITIGVITSMRIIFWLLLACPKGGIY